MARKKLGKAAKVLGGLGAAYIASGHIRPGVQPDEVEPPGEQIRMRKKEAPVEESVAPRAYVPDIAEHYVPGDTSLSRVRIPLSGLENYKSDAVYPEDTFKKGGSVSASRRADGVAQRGKTRGKMV